ncbi:MAG: putative selenium-dependent hydroxylase accessory protein YqeC, partial [Anaerolineales bacterium]|nr:putative selenium-dependent hydroxylase accessory protein YqeC [Anaerolineales bacterium]
DELEAALIDRHSHILVTGPLTENGQRWGRTLSDWIGKISVDAVLVEADGAKCLPFKAPAAHEPVIPAATTLLVPVVGLDAVGGRVRDMCHRPNQVCAITGLDMGDQITPSAIAAVLAHPDGGLKGRPSPARVRILINKADNDEKIQIAREIVSLLPVNNTSKRQNRIHAVVIGAIAARYPVVEVHRPVAAIVLAAGRSLRMKGDVPKQLLPWRGKTVIRQVVDTLSALPLDSVLVVVGHRAEKVTTAVEGTRAQTVLNPDYETGEMLSSAKAGIRALDERIGGCLVVLGDQPWLEPAVVQELLNVYARNPCGLVAPVFQGQRGNPVLIDRRYWPELLALADGLAPRRLLEAHADDVCLVPVETGSIHKDLDTWDDYQTSLQNE